MRNLLKSLVILVVAEVLYLGIAPTLAYVAWLLLPSGTVLFTVIWMLGTVIAVIDVAIIVVTIAIVVKVVRK